ncbi:uncharacterized protein F4807DRAFT_243707 [Annulohypoxylon truncatum]|uniref:uncharacterized protein n=1 Tax=Annulohypoxylon truncatum TaxID=327061 RepID=UPI00200818B3|nr:uncharacterized protein F4807DRAFT_243707 [Annulohypoxylon truncatum]KAI1206049.1 hypothetical protein F4807DRAFT_243707 [Annulohypoxylon truncatum]
MAIGSVKSRVRSFFRPGLAKRRRSSNTSSECEHKKIKNELMAPAQTDAINNAAVGIDGVGLDMQLASPFFRNLPIEIRRMIYNLVWTGPYDHKYHAGRGRHIHFQNGHWINARCVMYEDDEDLDLLQKNMDSMHSSGKGDLVMWQRRLASTWGCRHWRCEERMQYERRKSVDHTDFMSMMLVCKRMFPEVVESIFESHQFLFNDFFSAHRFFVYNPSPYIPYMRHLDLSLNLPFHEYAPFVIDAPKSRVRELWKALERISCLHTLRISLDIYDRGAWRKIPERGVTEQLRNLKVLKDFTLELPPSLPIKADIPNMHNLDAQGEEPFTVVRRPPLRYWQFTPGQVERFTWDTHTKGQQSHCFITLAREARNVPNPYLLDFF